MEKMDITLGRIFDLNKLKAEDTLVIFEESKKILEDKGIDFNGEVCILKTFQYVMNNDRLIEFKEIKPYIKMVIRKTNIIAYKHNIKDNLRIVE